MTLRFPNTELAVRNWLREQPDLAAALAVVAGSTPTTKLIDLDPHPTLPCVVVYRAGGAPDPYVPLDRATLGFDCWGTTASRARAFDLQLALCSALDGMASEALTPDVHGYTALIESELWAPDPGGRSRYVVTAVVTARRTTSQPALAG